MLKPTQDGFYWLHTEGSEPTIGKWSNAHGWLLLGKMNYYDPDDPADDDVLGKFRLGERVQLEWAPLLR